jgi:hypothetical protein
MVAREEERMEVQDRIERTMTFEVPRDDVSLFAYRWRPSKSDSATTLVEFRLEEVPGGTRLHLVESGFAALLAESRQDNEFGWDDELGQLREFLASRVSA